MSYKLMLLDDEPILLEGLTRQTDWHAYGFELVCTARNGLEGLEKFLDYQPDAILTDIRMRFMNGLDFIRQIRQIDPDVEIAVMSAFDIFEYAQQACNLGVTDYLLKPIRDDKLAHVLCTMYQRIDEKRSVASRLEQLDRYVIEQNNALQAIARKRILLGNCNPEMFFYAKFPKLQAGNRIHLVMIQDNEEHDTHLLNIPIENMFVEYADGSVLMHCAFDNGAICAVLYAETEDGEQEEQLINKFLDAVRSTTQKNLTVTIGSDVGCWEDIVKSYRSAEKQMRFARMLGINGLVSIPTSEESSRYPRDLEKQLLELANRSTAEEIQKWIKQLHSWSSNQPEKYVFAARGMFLRVLQRFIELDEIKITEYKQWYSRLETVLALPMEISIEKLSILIEQLYDSSQWERSVVGSYMNKVINQIKTYVLDHFEDSSLNIRSVAEHVHISAPYLGRLFKRTMGQSFNEYLNDVRIEKAKLLLHNINMKIGDVAAAVGYENQSYFQVLFKKKNSMTPGDYRAQNIDIKGEST
jgi:two-component system response regulator YesN